MTEYIDLILSILFLWLELGTISWTSWLSPYAIPCNFLSLQVPSVNTIVKQNSFQNTKTNTDTFQNKRNMATEYRNFLDKSSKPNTSIFRGTCSKNLRAHLGDLELGDLLIYTIYIHNICLSIQASKLFILQLYHFYFFFFLGFLLL